MAKYRDDGKSYVSMYPNIHNKWINECSVCHSQGYKPEMITKLNGEGKIVKNNLMRYFRPLELNGSGVCNQCNRYVNNRQ